MSATLHPDAAAVVVTYQPPPALVTNLRPLLAEVPKVVVVDNGSSAEAGSLLDAAEQLTGCRVIRLEGNRGIAAALNVGVRHVLANGAQFVFTFDQDSRVRAGFAEGMFRALEGKGHEPPVGIVAATCLDRNHSLLIDLPCSPSGEVLEAITSGNLVPASTFAKVGLFNEALFMDFVDIDFSLRCRRAGLRIVESRAGVLDHSLGRMEQHRLFGVHCHTSNHSPNRRYYIFRNRTYLLLRNLRDRFWVRHQLGSALRELVKVAMLESDRGLKLRRIVAGTWDGALGRMGKRFEL